jgi:hypothetical protein
LGGAQELNEEKYNDAKILLEVETDNILLARHKESSEEQIIQKLQRVFNKWKDKD